LFLGEIRGYVLPLGKCIPPVFGQKISDKLDRNYVNQNGGTINGNLSVNGEVTVNRLNSPSGADLVIDANHPGYGTLTLHDTVRIPDGDLSVNGTVTVNRLNSPSGADLFIDANQAGHGTLTLHDDVHIPDGDLDMNKHKINNVTRISSSGDSDLWIDAGAGTNRTLTLHDEVNIAGGNLTVRGDVRIDPGDSADIYLAGSRIGDWYDGTLHIQSGGSTVRFDGNDNVEISSGNLEMNNNNINNVTRISSSGDLWIDAGAGTHHTLTLHDAVRIPDGDLDMVGNRILNIGAIVEANLQTPEEVTAERIERFELGDVLCWAGERLERCALANDRLVVAVADENGKPIVIGAEPVKVVGPVRMGDLLVASDVAGYAMVNNQPAPGTVIAKALEAFDGEKGIVKAMIHTP